MLMDYDAIRLMIVLYLEPVDVKSREGIVEGIRCWRLPALMRCALRMISDATREYHAPYLAGSACRIRQPDSIYQRFRRWCRGGVFQGAGGRNLRIVHQHGTEPPKGDAATPEASREQAAVGAAGAG